VKRDPTLKQAIAIRVPIVKAAPQSRFAQCYWLQHIHMLHERLPLLASTSRMSLSSGINTEKKLLFQVKYRMQADIYGALEQLKSALSGAIE